MFFIVLSCFVSLCFAFYIKPSFSSGSCRLSRAWSDLFRSLLSRFSGSIPLHLPSKSYQRIGPWSQVVRFQHESHAETRNPNISKVRTNAVFIQLFIGNLDTKEWENTYWFVSYNFLLLVCSLFWSQVRNSALFGAQEISMQVRRRFEVAGCKRCRSSRWACGRQEIAKFSGNCRLLFCSHKHTSRFPMSSSNPD